jgi:hypothetical protein
MTDEEYASFMELDAAIKANAELQKQQDANKAEVLKKLGLSAEELKSLLG